MNGTGNVYVLVVDELRNIVQEQVRRQIKSAEPMIEYELPEKAKAPPIRRGITVYGKKDKRFRESRSVKYLDGAVNAEVYARPRRDT